MNKAILFMLTVLLALIAGCSTTTTVQEDNSKPLILTTFYPVEEITKAIVQDTAEVNVLVGAGNEPHSFEPTAKQIVEVSKSDIFVTMEGFFEHIEEEVIDANSNMKIIEATHNLELIKGDEHDHDEHESHEEEHDEHMHEEESHEDHDEHGDHEHHHDHHEEESHDEHEGHDHHDHGEFDPHVWLSIHNMEKMTEEILEHLIELYPENKELYEANAKVYLERLEVLEGEYNSKLASCEHDKVIVNHKAFGYLAHEYGFEQISVGGFSPETEPTPKAIQAVIDEAEEHNLTYIFSEGQLDPTTAQTIANDIGGEVLELNPIKLNEEEDYFSIMRANLDNLALGLGCE